jgi:hypothetical protein
MADLCSDRSRFFEIDERVVHALQAIARLSSTDQSERSLGATLFVVAKRARPRGIRIEEALLAERLRAKRRECLRSDRVLVRCLGVTCDPIGDDRRLDCTAPLIEGGAMQREPLFLVRRRVDAFFDERLAEYVALASRIEDARGDELAQTDVDIDRRRRTAGTLDCFDNGDELVAHHLGAEHCAHAREGDQLWAEAGELASSEPWTECHRRKLVEGARIEERLATRTFTDRTTLMDLAREHHEVQRIAVRDAGEPAKRA